jgi:hypothetical protein
MHEFLEDCTVRAIKIGEILLVLYYLSTKLEKNMKFITR